MLPKINRIKNKKDFDKAFKNSKSLKDKFIIFKASKNKLDLVRFGFVISQKVSKKATVRNKIRRRLANITKKEKATIKSGTDIVLIGLPGIEEKSFLELKEVVKNALLKLGLSS